MHVLIPALHRPTKPTGVCRHAANLARCLADVDRVGHVTVIIGKWQQAYFEDLFGLDSAKVEIVTVDISNSSLSRNRWFVFGLPKLAEQIQPDIIHLSFPFPFVRRWFSAPVVSTIHDLYPYEYPENFGYPRVWFNQLFLRQCLYQSDGLVCVSNCTLEALKAYFPRVEKTSESTVIYNVVESISAEPKRPSQLGHGTLSPFLMTVAQHRKNKNLDLLIQTYSQLRCAHQLPEDTWLIIVGSAGPETDNLNDLVKRLNLGNRVMFLAGLDDGELRWLYEHAALFVIPSSTEGFCLPLVEALIASCPVVCSDIPIFQEVGSSACHYFSLDGQPSQQLYKAIASKLDSQLPTETLTDARFSRKEISQRLLDFYMLF